MPAPDDPPQFDDQRRRAPPAGRTVAVVVSGTIERADIPALCARLEAILRRSDADVVLCDVGDLADVDAVAVDALARLQLTARRFGRRVWLRRAGGELEELLALAGLGEVLACAERSGLEAGRQAEQREQARGVEEEGDPGDPSS